MSTFDVSRMAQCRECLGSLVIRTDHTGSYYVHTGTWLTRCVARRAQGKTATPAPVFLTQADVQLVGVA